MVPEVNAGQAVISAIAVATLDNGVKPAEPRTAAWSWRDADMDVIEKMPSELLPKDENARAAVTYEAEKAKCTGRHQIKEFKKQTGVFFNGKGSRSRLPISVGWLLIHWKFSKG